LIDVQKQCVVKATSNKRFVALSYVWGNAQPLLATKSNIDDLQTPGGLANTDPPLANIICDAMMLVSAVGERYLWADTVCIVQDDPYGKKDAIDHMDVIYGQALFTIIAASTNSADQGLPGVQPKSRPLVNLEDKIKGEPLVWRGPELSDMMEYSPYEQRAWTFQERLISRRCLYLSQHQAYFQCITDYDCEIYHDSAFWEHNYKRGRALPVLYNPLNTTNVWSYAIYVYIHLTEAYTPRQLSSQTDALNAVQGVLGVLGQVCQTEFIYALPENIFDLALLWASARHCHIKRRKGVNFPSWSWLGWIGPISYD
ncbi:heterokaryon incompatibility protein-domain-containing protein, partial [Paraphoma chrysanthemicola]